jgi:hypothetical protein
MRLPTPNEVADMQATLGVTFHPSYEKFLLQASDVNIGGLEPATITRPASHTYLPKVVEGARQWGVPDELFPICEDNSDFFCMTEDGKVVLWSHDGMWKPTVWPNLESWIHEVWLAD